MNNKLIINVADIIPEGSTKSYRQMNAEKIHNIPLGSLVKVLKYNFKLEKYEDDPHGLTLYVVRHGRDCDQTPLYDLSFQTLEEYLHDKEFFNRAILEVDGMRLRGEFAGPKTDNGYSEENLKIVALPNELEKE